MAETIPDPLVQLEIRKSADAELEVGGLRLVACRREVGQIDGGVTLYVWGSPGTGKEDVEVLRCDLFRDRPHYHAPAENQAETAIDSVPGESIAWGIQAISTRAKDLVAQGGNGAIGNALVTAALVAAGPAMQSLFDGLGEPTEVSSFGVPASVLESLKG